MPESPQSLLRKVCGLTRPDDAVHAAQAGASAVGLVFVPGSLRAVTVEGACKIVETLPAEVLRVGVFVAESPACVADTARRVGLDVVQLHGDESPRDCARIRVALAARVRIWKAIRVGPRFDAAGLDEFEVEAFLLDTARRGAHGGTGATFPWHLALRAKRYGKVVLAGGLDGQNVAAAVHTVAPWGVDASSKLESRPGIKDPRKVTHYLAAARRVP